MRALIAATVAVTASASNWAQTTGVHSQNTAIPYVPSKQHPHWSGRMGMATAVSNVSDVGETFFNGLSYMFLIGGDDYDVDAASRSSYDQANPVRGMRNDVWKLSAPGGETWRINHDMIDRTRYDHKLPKQHSLLEWELVSPGKIPDTGETYEQFIQCQEFYPPHLGKSRTCSDDMPLRNRGMFSPRRMHQVAIHGNKLYVIGGRAREHARLADERAVGGLIGARQMQDIGEAGYSSWHETSVLKNDVWVSRDWGETWKLVEAGCKSNQRELLLRDRESTDDEERLATMFNPALRCVDDADCYGNQELCDNGVCVCQFWSPREQHRVSVFGQYMYLLGGFASVHMAYCDGMACGDVDAGGYRAYMNDVWYAKLLTDGTDAITWQALTTGAPWPGRGGHAVATVQLLPVDGSRFALYILGGKTGATADKVEDAVLNDVWYTEFPPPGEDPVGYISASSWKLAFEDVAWPPRTGHVAVVDVPSAANLMTQRLFVVGGEDGAGSLLDDVWSWGWECEKTPAGVSYSNGRCDPSENGGTLRNATVWRKDYEDDALFRIDSGANMIYDQGQPQQHYVSADSPAEMLVKVYLPLSMGTPSYDGGYPTKFREDVGVYGMVPRRKPLIDERRLAMLHTLGIRTIADLAHADRAAILELRGYRFPGAVEIFDSTYDDVCDHRNLAIAVIRKCTVDMNMNELLHYDQEPFMPWNVDPKYDGAAPPILNNANNSFWGARWHGKSFHAAAPQSEEAMIAEWDGCAPMGLVNVPGIGDVPSPPSIRNPYRELQELVCKQNPGGRAYHVGVYFNQKVYVMGGLKDARSMKSFQDMWYRDDVLPRATLSVVPRKLDFGANFLNYFSEPEYQFRAKWDKEGTIFEYMVYDADEHAIVRTWDKTKGKAQVNWLDEYYEEGPGSGTYIFYIRALDAAGNVDVSYSGANMYKWKYKTRLPWDRISISIGCFIGSVLIVHWDYKRRKKRAAMERYAIKRMRRKFKGAQKDLASKGGVDWRKMMDEDKKKRKKKEAKDKAGANTPGKKKKKDGKDREKEKMKKQKQKEKEKLKKKKE